MVVKFELLADLDTEPNQATVRFEACDNLGAVNLRGNGLCFTGPGRPAADREDGR